MLSVIEWMIYFLFSPSPKRGVQPIYSPDFLFRALLSSAGGIILGIIISLIVNCTLLEISLNAFFATYFGLLFVAVGGIILCKGAHIMQPPAAILCRVSGICRSKRICIVCAPLSGTARYPSA